MCLFGFIINTIRPFSTFTIKFQVYSNVYYKRFSKNIKLNVDKTTLSLKRLKEIWNPDLLKTPVTGNVHILSVFTQSSK